MDRSGATAWVVGDDDRAAFVVASGDRNPIHTDPVAARRLLGGRMLVHGAHTVLAVLDQAIAGGLLDTRPAGLTVTFRRGVEPGTPLSTRFAREPGGLAARVTDDVWSTLDVTITITTAAVAPVATPSDNRVATPVDNPVDIPFGEANRGGPTSGPADLELGSMADVSGRFDTATDVSGAPAIVTRLFPDAVRVLGIDTALEIASISGVVGMRVPGLRSMSSRYDIRFGPDDEASGSVPTGLSYRVQRADPRLRRVLIGLVGRHVTATVTAFSPPGPVDQRAVLAGRERPVPAEFADRRVLVVGGSRGLGEAAVRLLVGGGADVRFTHHLGIDDAARVTADTGAGAVAFDARTGTIEPSVLGGWLPTHVAWFATPPTAGSAPGVFSARWFDDLRSVQVDAFERSVDTLARHGLTDVLWPSAIGIDQADPTTDELVAVRLAGEHACAALSSRHPALSVVAARLPRLLTDNTVSLLPAEYGDTAAELLAALRTRR